MKDKFEKIHNALAAEPLQKGIQLYFSPLKESDILFIGINPGAGFFNYEGKIVKRFSPLKHFEYIGQKYYLATQTKKVFKDMKMDEPFIKATKINHFPFATKDKIALDKLLEKYDKEHKMYYLSKEFVKETIEIVKPKLIICEGKSSFDRLKDILKINSVEYKDDTYVLKTEDFVAIGYRRNLSHIKNKDEFKSKIKQYYKATIQIPMVGCHYQLKTIPKTKRFK